MQATDKEKKTMGVPMKFQRTEGTKPDYHRKVEKGKVNGFATR